MGTPTLSTHPLGTHAKLGESDDTQLHYPKGFIAADDNTMMVKGNDSEIAYTGAIYTIKVNVTSAELLAISTTPKTIITAAGNGKVIRIIGVVTYLNYGTTTYEATDTLQLVTSIGRKLIGEIDCTAITNTNDRWQTGAGTLKNVELVENSDIVLTSDSNPTSGDGTLDVYVTYQILV